MEAASKVEAVANSLVEHLDLDLEIETAQYRVGYRNRIRMAVVDGVADFYNQAKRDGCVVLTEELQTAIDELRTLTRQDSRALAGVSNLEVRTSSQSKVNGVYLTDGTDCEPLSELLGDRWLVATPLRNSDAALTYDLGAKVCLDVPLGSFVQVNETMNRRILKFVVEAAMHLSADSFIDLYGGAGNHSARLIDVGLGGWLLESSEVACRSALKSLGAAGLEVVAGDAIENLNGIVAADLVVCNPPRAGVSRGHELIARKAKKAIIYISCNPLSLKRDLEVFSKLGLEISNARCFDMFSGTDHVETAVVLTHT